MTGIVFVAVMIITFLMMYVIPVAICLLASIKFIHMLQLESYQAPGYIRWLKTNGKKKYWLLIISAVIFLASTVTEYKGYGGLVTMLLMLASYAVAVVYIIVSKNKDAKKPLKYTARIKRFIAGEVLLLVIAGVIGSYIYTGVFPFALLIALLPLFVLFVHFMMYPIEKTINNWYMNDAKKKLSAKKALITIGITGSYGKTSVKYILGTILSEKYNVLVPPSSYNTPMGVTRVIREQLKDEHQVFIAEMGARHVGDIKELVDFVHPKYGIITSVGPQHLETFFTIENVQNTKYELIAGLPKDGAGFFPDDSDGLNLAKPLYEREIPQEKTLFGFNEDDDVYAYDTKIDGTGSTFSVKLKNGESFTAHTKLLGKHNVMNILGAVAMAEYLGLSSEEIARGIRKIEPVEHRLQLLPTNNGVNVIDDAFNSNPSGAKAAVEVLSYFEGRKIIVTPGMVELGAEQDAKNAEFALEIAKVADIVYLVGRKQTASMYGSLKTSGFDMEKVFVCGSLNEASTQMGSILRVGDTVLFENDLPDNYSE